jgi:muramoyltetrapeptide carboxypeptidase
MEALPAGLIESAGKLIIGYSDVTTYSSGWSCAHLPSVHACMSATFDGLADACVEAERRVLAGEAPTYTCPADGNCREGEAEGVLIGGNLATLTSVLGTAYDCTQVQEPYILFLEDVGEDVRHVHRYLTVLKHLGILDKAQGIVFGEWCEVPAGTGDLDSRGEFGSVDDMIAELITADLDVPVAFGFPAGHADVNYPLIMGMPARLSVRPESYTLTCAAKDR